MWSHFDLSLGDKGLRIGHWNVNRLTSAKFEQLKFFLLGKSGRPQVDVLFLNETFLKPNIPDSLWVFLDLHYIAVTDYRDVVVATRPISETCLDHIFSNQPQRIQNINCPVIGFADHLPLFAARTYNNALERRIRNASNGNTFIRYRDTKRFSEEQFMLTLEQTPRDTIFVFDEIDDMLVSWENLFNEACTEYTLHSTTCPRRVLKFSQFDS